MHTSKGKSSSEQLGFTLIELLVVIVIIGLLASFVGPRLFGKVETSKIQAARFQIEQLGTALEIYRLDVGKYPDSLQKLIKSSGDKWHGPYLEKNKIPPDPWGDSYQYQMVAGGKQYRLSSKGGGEKPINSWE